MPKNTVPCPSDAGAGTPAAAATSRPTTRSSSDSPGHMKVPTLNRVMEADGPTQMVGGPSNQRAGRSSAQARACKHRGGEGFKKPKILNGPTHAENKPKHPIRRSHIYSFTSTNTLP